MRILEYNNGVVNTFTFYYGRNPPPQDKNILNNKKVMSHLIFMISFDSHFLNNNIPCNVLFTFAMIYLLLIKLLTFDTTRQWNTVKRLTRLLLNSKTW